MQLLDDFTQHIFTSSALLSLGGLVLAAGLAQKGAWHMPNNGWCTVLAGALAGGAMLLPGISGSTILLLLGKYALLLKALQGLQIDVLGLFALGSTIGLLSCAKLVGRLLGHYYNATMAFLAGTMLGTLHHLWPWNSPPPAPPQHLTPAQFQAVHDQDPMVLQALVWLGLGLLLVTVLARKSRGTKQPT